MAGMAVDVLLDAFFNKGVLAGGFHARLDGSITLQSLAQDVAGMFVFVPNEKQAAFGAGAFAFDGEGGLIDQLSRPSNSPEVVCETPPAEAMVELM